MLPHLPLTHTLEESSLCPHPFVCEHPRNSGAAPNLGCLRTNQEYTLCANCDLIGIKVSLPGQVKVRCALRDRLQIWRSCCEYSFSQNVLKLSGLSFRVDTYRMYILWFFILVNSGQVNFQPGIWESYSFAHNFWTKGDKRMKWTPRCVSCGPKSNDTQYDQLWPDLTCDPKVGGRSNFEIYFWEHWVPLDLSQREKHDDGKFVAVRQIVLK